MSDRTVRIRELNDRFRQDPWGEQGCIVHTQSVAALGHAFLLRAIGAIGRFDGFTTDNDPHGEHDFGIVDVHGTKLYFKIDYYDLDQRYHSEDASDPVKTMRVMTVMTIMLPEDY